MTTHGKKGRNRPKLGKARLPYKERLKRGFSRVERDLSWMMGIFQELLGELGEKEAGEALPWVSGAKGMAVVKEGKITRGYAIAFGLLNLAEEVAAASMRQLSEAINGPQHEPGSWAQALCRLKVPGRLRITWPRYSRLCGWSPYSQLIRPRPGGVPFLPVCRKFTEFSWSGVESPARTDWIGNEGTI